MRRADVGIAPYRGTADGQWPSLQKKRKELISVNKRQHRVCEVCGAILDPGEPCDCGGQAVRAAVSLQGKAAGNKTDGQWPSLQAKTKSASSRRVKWVPKPGTEAARYYKYGT